MTMILSFNIVHIAYETSRRALYQFEKYKKSSTSWLIGINKVSQKAQVGGNAWTQHKRFYVPCI